MKVKQIIGNKNLAEVFVAKTNSNKLIEFAYSMHCDNKKIVLTLSTLYGCPVACKFCDAGGYFEGNISEQDIFKQISTVLNHKFGDNKTNLDEFKIQFARMGEPTFNADVLKVLTNFPKIYNTKNFVPSISTIAPEGCETFLENLLEIKNKFYKNTMQMQFSIHSTNEEKRNWLMPVKKWNFEKIANYGNRFFTKGGKKITLNFAVAQDSVINVDELKKYFDTNKFLIKITPINPTNSANKNKINSGIKTSDDNCSLIAQLKKAGYEVILSMGELEENEIGSNCGQYLTNHTKK
ncbi:MAG: radical SAM protein [Elusimicrobiaceae bacterium]|jgi:23S rRNA (adenine2503-C2)-methyltransferase|nr:radical SAM protein [Elusimicrobiaceae bacterium]MBT3954811.1 radical SAM protein [Elusimicrobiaceae bacterium]MBT4008805.1 radical SAM protein [Elusimicrobiaceae bacterium]MBT4402251.1 radical SAM protein [Elusimicrobiaceae bacterium]MBT4440292.1 radical SAM protein [Elusimicrobiaceae bacterium]